MSLSFYGLSKSYNGKTIFENISGKINSQDKIGLVGVNGSGKTTLARILAGYEVCDMGNIRRSSSNARVLYIEQHPIFKPMVSVYDEIDGLASTFRQDHMGDRATVVKRALNRVGLDEEKWRQRAVSLSGGEKTKLALCKALVSDFDFLILDEPTNHIDMKSYLWLEEFVRNLSKPMLIISHDRFFLDRAVGSIWELGDGELRAYEGNYSAYRTQQEIERTSMVREYEKQQAKIQHLKQMIHERENWYKSAHQAAGQNDFYRAKAKKHASVLKAKERELERIEKNKVDKPRNTVSPAFEVINKSIIGKKFPPFLVQGKNLGKAYGTKVIFENISFNIGRKDKIALIGQNGVGKTTLLKIICGLDQDFSGGVKINPSLKIGYFAQELDNLSNQSTILEEVLSVGSTIEEARLLLACLLFRGEDVYKKIENLSMGEKGRVAFAKLILSGATLLVLDEPTNYMDIASKEKIEEVLGEFAGAVIFVSHDRYFIQRIANRIVVIDHQKLRCYDGDYDYFLTKEKEEKSRSASGIDYRDLANNVSRLECELAFLSGKLNEMMDIEEKEKLNQKFLSTVKELNIYRNLLKNDKYN
ncbi:ABC-F family ATP-binding cassette domain-containing protein [Desulfotomaculum defluvii]